MSKKTYPHDAVNSGESSEVRVVGRMTGSAVVKTRFEGEDVLEHPNAVSPWELYAGYVAKQVREIMDKTGNIPMSVTVNLRLDDDA
jgi:hypothetical protein